ncbi:MAG: hypothetical protein J5518_06275 [Lachnospiraceae bacterium]|nr:hypothetical protein [Lachnospiraceae bacterium]
MKFVAILALFTGMALAFLQGFHVYAAGETVQVAQTAEATDNIALEETVLPAAAYPTGIFPWWCWVIVIASVAVGIGVYGYIKHEEKKSRIELS